MRFALSLVGGLIAGAVLSGVLVYALVLPVMRSTANDDGLLRLPRGASSWSRVAGGPAGPCHGLWSFGDGVVMTTSAQPMEWTAATGAWTPSTRSPPARAAVGSGARWFLPEGGKAFSLAEGDCQLFAEPQHEALPRFPTCPAKAPAADAVTQLDDQSILALRVDEASGKYRGWQLGAGTAEWKDLGPLDVPLASGELVAGARGEALFVSSAGALVALQDGQWKTLPTEQSPRTGQKAVLLADGAVVACGGRRELRAQNLLVNVGLPFGVLAVFLFVALRARARPLPLLLGFLGGVAVTGAITLVVLLTSGWH